MQSIVNEEVVSFLARMTGEWAVSFVTGSETR